MNTLIGRIKKRVNKLFAYLSKISANQDELVWAQVYHDTIRGQENLMKMSVSPGRWSGGYSFLYVLVRILMDYKPSRILEMGLGESTKLISTFYFNQEINLKHHVMEHDITWLNFFKEKNKTSPGTEFLLCPLGLREMGRASYHSYGDFTSRILPKYDFYVVDGPFGSDHFSRYDIVTATDSLEKGDEFIILLDDYNRPGEVETGQALIKQFRDREITIHTNIYQGSKYQLVIATEKYKWACSL